MQSLVNKAKFAYVTDTEHYNITYLLDLLISHHYNDHKY